MRSRIDPWTTVVVVALLLGAVFRLAGLEDRLVWHDEVYTRFFAAGRAAADWQAVLYGGGVVTAGDVVALQQHDPSATALDTIAGLARDEPQHPPLYYVLAGLHVRWFGDSIRALRALSAVFGLLALPAMWWLCRELFPRQLRVRQMGTALLALSPYFVLFSTEARDYALWGLWILVTSAALLRALRVSEQTPERSLGAWALVSATLTLSLYTSFSMVWVIAAQVLFVILRDRRRWRRESWMAAAAMGVAALLFLPWALILRTHWDAFRASMEWSRVIAIPRSELLGSLLLNASRPFVDVGPTAVGVERLLVAGVVTLAIGALVALAREAPPGRGLVLGLTLIPLGFLLVPDLIFWGIRSLPGRYLAPCWLAVLIAVAWALGRDGPQPRGRTAVFGVLLLLAVASNAQGWGQITAWHQPISSALPTAAVLVATADDPLVVGNREAHHGGNLLALALRVPPSTRLQFAPLEEDYVLADHPGTIYLFSPNDPFRKRLEEQFGVTTRPVFATQHLWLWEVVRPR